MLQAISPTSIPDMPWSSTRMVHVFTDGTCCHPCYPDLRYAAYSVVLSDPTQAQPACILDSGPLPGLRQTSIRAELYAIHRAVKFASLRQQNLLIWSDCLAVVRRLRRILMGPSVKMNSPNSDLWRMIADDIRSGCVVQVTKVAAHQDLRCASSPLEEWCFLHNRFADRAAARAIMSSEVLSSGLYLHVMLKHAKLLMIGMLPYRRFS
jgi:ribonuclease HI